MLARLQKLFRRKARAPSLPTATPARVSLASAVVLAAGAGAALWWWTQWSRGRAESEDDAAAPPK